MRRKTVWGSLMEAKEAADALPPRLREAVEKCLIRPIKYRPDHGDEQW